MKITIIAPEFPPQIGGMEKYAFELVKILSKNNEVSVIVKKDYENVDYKNIGLNNVDVVPILTLDFDDDVNNIIDYIKDKNIDVVHINNAGFSPAVLEIKSKLNIPVVATTHGKDFIEPFIYPEKDNEIKKGLIKADKIITVSNFVKNKLTEYGVNKKSIKVVLHGTDQNLFKPKQKNEQLLKKYSILADDKVLLSVCRIHPIKGLERVINVIPELLERGCNIKYLIIGPVSDKSYFRYLKDIVKSLKLEKSVVFVREVDRDDLVDYYNLCDIYIMLSGDKKLKESFGISFIEASACGKAVMGPKNSGASDAIINGKTGFLVDVDNKKEVENVIIKLLKNKKLREKLGKAGRERVIKELNWENCSKRVLEVYKDVLKSKPSIITFNKYPLSNESFINGANLYYNEVSRILGEEDFNYFDFNDIVNKKNNIINIIKNLKEKDTIITNCGPYAYIYHYLRQKYDLKFRIVRDVQAALWHGYLLQEELCSNYLQEGDVVLFPSEYARQLYIKLFRHITKGNSFVCYPMMHFFPKVKKIKKENKKKGLTIGYIGRVCYEKNFKQALDAFVTVSKQLKDVKIMVAGQVEDSRFNPKIVKKRLIREGINPNNYKHINDGRPIPYERIWDVYKQIDLLLFPSVANIETLGRIIIESSYLGIPVVATEHAACPELLDKRNLVKVDYFKKIIALNGSYPLGYLNTKELCDKILNHKKLSKNSKIKEYENHHKKLLRILNNEQKPERLRKLNPNIKNFIDNIEISSRFDLGSSEKAIKKAIDILKKTDYRIFSITPKQISNRLGFWAHMKI